MVSVKIECGCGQHYSFDVMPVNGKMGSAVACPTCGADGTEVANDVIASKLAPPYSPPTEAVPVPSSTGGARLRIGATDHESSPASPGVRVDSRSLGLVDRETAETEARAKISWGDSQDSVVRYLMLQGFSVPDAEELVGGLYQERLTALRVKGVKKVVLGVGMMFVPVIAFFAGVMKISIKLMGLAILVGAVGFWNTVNGIIILVAPKMESGDVAE